MNLDGRWRRVGRLQTGRRAADRIYLLIHYRVCPPPQLLDRRMAAAEGGGVQALGALDSQMAEVEDMISYCSDTLSIGGGGGREGQEEPLGCMLDGAVAFGRS